ncbi:hypothetical protein H4R20_002623 [Coemansia guatemalensis]|uniref:Uncharacterized protein n=1 Tax=Coemansia guatemalensis TaxID=2761395 RepID=A0A9W8HV56_9FUNG|nr:hypothetical protein H4R20_002623 [Coemansia guatemalensis]
MAIKRIAFAAIAAFAATSIAAPQDELPTDLDVLMSQATDPAFLSSISAGMNSLENLLTESPGLLSSLMSDIPTDFSLSAISHSGPDLNLDDLSDSSTSGSFGEDDHDHDHDHSDDEHDHDHSDDEHDHDHGDDEHDHDHSDDDTSSASSIKPIAIAAAAGLSIAAALF